MAGGLTGGVADVIFYSIMGFILLAAYSLCLLPKKKVYKIIMTTIVTTLFFWPVMKKEIESIYYSIKITPSKMVFKKRCADATEKIYKTVKDVDGILLLNTRAEKSKVDYRDVNLPDAGLISEAGGHEYIESFLKNEYHRSENSLRTRTFRPEPGMDIYAKGYSYVDVIEGAEIARYSYKYDESLKAELIRKEMSNDIPRYAVFFLNIIIPKDRVRGIAGSTVVIKDRWTNEILAEKTWYAFAPTFVKYEGYGHDWRTNMNCPQVIYMNYPTREFVSRVIQSKQDYQYDQ